jgi:hypothetical protein
MNTEETAIARINSFSPDDWEELLSLIPEIERSPSFGKFHPSEKIKVDEYSFPVWEPGPLIDRFQDIVYKMPIMVPFNWSKWDEGRKIASDPHFNFNTTDIPTKCKLITALVRNDRFCDGVLVNAFESGLILKLLISIRQQLIKT